MPCPRCPLSACALASLSCLVPALAPAADAQKLPPVTVTGQVPRLPRGDAIELQQQGMPAADAASLLQRAPGANLNRNGPLTGIAQYRGMYGDRLNVLLDGVYINSGGPNGMDPALSYLPASQLQSIEVIRGIAPVSSGTETIGGTIVARSRTPAFGTSDQPVIRGSVSLAGASADSSHDFTALGGLANRHDRFYLFGTDQRGNDLHIPQGTVRPTQYQRRNAGLGYGFRHGAQTFDLRFRHNRTDNTGTPSLPMDILFIDGDIYQAEYRGRIGAHQLHASLYHTDVDHEMANYVLRRPPNPAKTHLNHATSTGNGYRVDLRHPLAGGELLAGSDGHFDRHDSTITDPVNNPMFRVLNFSGVQRAAYGLFAQWQGPVAGVWDLQLGLRYNRVTSDAGKVDSSMAMMKPPVRILRDRFNQSARRQTDGNLDLVVKARRPLGDAWHWSLEAGRKTRSPSYQQRYLWLPLQSTNGLADGHNYVGRVDLKPEAATEFGLGLDWRRGTAYASPRVFYRYVNGYIQGTPATDTTVRKLSANNGDPDPLQWTNVDARFYGLDLDAGMALAAGLDLSGTLSYVRGERADISDDLYRIAPLNARLSLRWAPRDGLWTRLTLVGYARQNRVSRTNGETRSPGYGLVDLAAGIELPAGLNLQLSLDNLFDRRYAPHLAGINRVQDSDVAPGRRLPGAGRSWGIRLGYRFL